MIDDRLETPEERDAALAGEYVLRLLPAEEAAACAAREATDPAFAAQVAAWRADLEGLDGAFAEAAPPAGLERRIEARLFGREPSGLARLWASVGLWRAVAAAAVLAVLWVGLLAPPAPQPTLVSALGSVNSDVELLAVYEPRAAVLSLNRTSGAPAPGRSLELWLIEGGQPPVSLGVLPDAAEARLSVPDALAARLGPGAQLAVSDEQDGGSTTGLPGEVVALGAVAEI